MTNTHYSAYGGTCTDCTTGRTWVTPLGDRVRLCVRHGAIVSEWPGWRELEPEHAGSPPHRTEDPQ